MLLRAGEIDVISLDRCGAEAVPAKARLSVLLGRLDTDAGVHAVAWETKYAVPRKLVLTTVAQLTKQIELLAKLLGELEQEGTVNVLITPEWLTLRGTILPALATYPEAKAAVATQLTGGG